MTADQRLVELGLTLPPPQKPQGNYVPFRLAGNLLFLAGVGPQRCRRIDDDRQGRCRGQRGTGL